MNKSNDEVNELSAIGITLSSQKGNKDKDNDIVGNIGWVLDDLISNQKNGSDILEAVWGKQESNTGGLNGISENWLDFLLNSTFIENSFGLLNEDQKFCLGSEVVRVLQ